MMAGLLLVRNYPPVYKVGVGGPSFDVPREVAERVVVEREKSNEDRKSAPHNGARLNLPVNREIRKGSVDLLPV